MANVRRKPKKFSHLTEEKFQQIKQLQAAKLGTSVISQVSGLSKATISKIKASDTFQAYKELNEKYVLNRMKVIESETKTKPPVSSTDQAQVYQLHNHTNNNEAKKAPTPTQDDIVLALNRIAVNLEKLVSAWRGSQYINDKNNDTRG